MVSESKIVQMKFDKHTPSYMVSKSFSSELNDETSLVQLGQSAVTMFHDYTPATINASSFNRFPTKEKPNRNYKFTSLSIDRNLDLVSINRSTYSLLDWLGDVGGLFDALRLIAEFLIAPVSALALKQKLASHFEQKTTEAAETAEAAAKSAKVEERESPTCLGKYL